MTTKKISDKISFIWNHPLRNLVIIGLFIKIPLAFFTAWSDTTRFWEMENKVLANPKAMLAIYPPPWLLTMNLFIWSLSLFYDPSNFAVAEPALAKPWYMLGINQLFITSPVFNFVLKAPLLIADLLVGLIIYSIVSERFDLSFAKKAAKKAFTFWYFNPFVILSIPMMSQTDVLVALFMLVSFYFVLKGEYAFSGLSLGLSIFYKTYNAYVMPFFLLMVAFELGRQSKSRLEHLKIKGIKNAIKFLGGFSIPYLLLAPSIRFFGSLWGAWVTIPQLFGFNIWGIITLYPPAQEIKDWAYSNFFSLISFLFIAGIGLATVIILFITFRLRGDSTEKLIHGIVAILSITFLTLSVTNPHQIISMLPFLVLLSVLYKRWSTRYWYLSLTGVGFIVLMRGPYQFFFPLGEYTPIVSIEQLANLILKYGAMSGVINRHLNQDYMLLFSVIGVTILLSFLFPKIRVIHYIRNNGLLRRKYTNIVNRREEMH
jgi:hypothetical protein